MEGLLNGRYRLGDPLVHEGPGELFAAQDLLTGASCQVRVLAAQAPKGALGPLLEGRVRHPHIEAVLGSESRGPSWHLRLPLRPRWDTFLSASMATQTR